MAGYDCTRQGRRQPPGEGESTRDINSSAATAAASMKLPGKNPSEILRKESATAKLPGKGNQPLRFIPTSNQSGADPIRNKSPTYRQDTLQLNNDEHAECHRSAGTTQSTVKRRIANPSASSRRNNP